MGLPSPAAAQERTSFRQLTISDGLSQNAVSAITQDHRGFMWFGTKDGLDRYDGSTFVVFRHDPYDASTLSDNHVTALLEDSRKDLWVGTQVGGVNRFDRVRESFQRYDSGPSRPITAIAEDLDGHLWIGTDGDGVFRLPLAASERADVGFERIDPGGGGHPEATRVLAILVDGRGTVWVGTEGGLYRLDRGATLPDGFVRYGKGPQAGGLMDETVGALIEDRRGRIWIGGVAGLSTLDVDGGEITHYFHRYRTYRYGWGEAIELLEDRAGRIWMSTHSELMRFDPALSVFTYLRHDPRRPEGISSNLPTALFEDRAGVVWIGTNGYGIEIHDPKATRFQTFRRAEDRPHRQAGFSVYTLLEDSSGRIWIDAGLLYRWDRKTDELVSFETSSTRPDDFGNTGVWSLVEDPPGFLWAGTYQGLYHYEIATGRARQWKHDPADPGGLPEPQVRGVHRTREGVTWVVTPNYVARLVDARTGRFRSYRYTPEGTGNEWTFPSLHEDREGTFWFGSNFGLVRFDPTPGTVRLYRSDPRDPRSLSHDVVRSICPDPREPDRYLWIGTAGGGLNRFDRSSETFEHYTVEDGLPNNVVYGVLPDDVGNLWLSTNRGLSRFDPETGHFRNYDAADGLQSDEFNSGAYVRTASGELLFGGLYGFNYFRPDQVRDNVHVPEIVLTALKRGNRYESVRDSGTVLRTTISEAEALELSYRDNVITFEFAALDYSAPTKNRYAYRMMGFNQEWIESGPVRSATYTNLPPGSYTFQVKGSNNDGLWNEAGASIRVTVVPPWWRTAWAYALYGLLGAGLLWGARRSELNRIRLKSRLALEHVEAEKLRVLDHTRSRSFANVSHEFRTPLTLTLGPLDDLQSGLHGQLPEPVQEQVELAHRNAARVLDLINQILELARLEAGCAPVRARKLDLGAFVGNAAHAFVPLGERKRISFEIVLPNDGMEVYADPEHLEKVVSNLLSNALKFTPEGGAVRVTATASPDAARIAVRDSGPGIPAGDLAHVFDRFYRVQGHSGSGQPGTGIGLALAKELVELHGGSLTVESEEGFGSTFMVALRLGHAHFAPEQIASTDGVWTPPKAMSVAPLGSVQPEGAQPAEVEPADDDVTTVLVVEDNAEVRAYLRKHLLPVYRVLEAEDGERALRLARQAVPDLVLSDVMTSGIDGYELCHALKNDVETDFIPVILLTARAASEDRLAGLREQADDYLTKPFDPAELLARIENLIAMRKRLRERFARPTTPTLHAAPQHVASADDRFVEQVRAVIESELADETFSVERLAHRVAHSRGHLHRRLRALLNESPSDLIRRMRLERAAQLIEARSGSIAEIAYSVGFKSVSHFSNSFLEHFAVRPSAYAGGTSRAALRHPGD